GRQPGPGRVRPALRLRPRPDRRHLGPDRPVLRPLRAPTTSTPSPAPAATTPSPRTASTPGSPAATASATSSSPTPTASPPPSTPPADAHPPAGAGGHTPATPAALTAWLPGGHGQRSLALTDADRLTHAIDALIDTPPTTTARPAPPGA